MCFCEKKVVKLLRFRAVGGYFLEKSVFVVGTRIGCYILRKKNMEYYFVTTDSLQERAWFRDEDDFKVGMNTVAVVADSSQTHVRA